VTDFNGEFEGMGVAKGGAVTPKTRKKPKLLEFAAVTPEYKAECQDDVTPGTQTYDANKMNEVGLELNDGNPCKEVAGTFLEDGEAKGFTYAASTVDSSFFPNYQSNKQDPSQIAGMVIGTILGGGVRPVPFTKEKKMSGVDYLAPVQAFDRQRYREWAEKDSVAMKDLYLMISGKLNSVLQPAAKALPSVEAAPLGVGAEINTGGIASKVMNAVKVVMNMRAQIVDAVNQWRLKDSQRRDQRWEPMFLRRVFCDLHCIRDITKAGDDAILQSIVKSHEVMSRNMDNLMEYYSDTLHDSLDEMKLGMEANTKQLEKIRTQVTKKTKKSSLMEVNDNLNGMFTEMKQLLERNMDDHGRATTMRALDAYAGSFSHRNHPNFTAAGAASLSDRLASETALLMSTLRFASSHQIGNAEKASLETASSLRTLNLIMRGQNLILGIYADTSKQQRQDQQHWSNFKRLALEDVSDEVWKASANSLLLDIDRSWWSLRSTLDDFQDVCNDEHAAFHDALIVLDQYTSKCTASFSDLKLAHSRARKTNRATHKQLHITWHSVENEFGLLTSKLVDTEAFHQLLRLDAARVSLAPHRSDICSGSLKSAVSAVNVTLGEGLTSQTWNQLIGVVIEMHFLEDRFVASGLPPPEGKTFQQAWQRAVSAYSTSFLRHGDVALEAVQRYRDHSCPRGEGQNSDGAVSLGQIAAEKIASVQNSAEKAINQKQVEINRLTDEKRAEVKAAVAAKAVAEKAAVEAEFAEAAKEKELEETKFKLEMAETKSTEQARQTDKLLVFMTFLLVTYILTNWKRQE